MHLKLPEFSKSNVLVVGDIMLDHYWQGNTSRISPEAPVPVVHVGSEEYRPGGAANVALNIAALNAKATLLGVTGDDRSANVLQELLEEKGVDCQFIKQKDVETITKLRIISRQQQLIRLDFEKDLASVNADALIEKYKELLHSVDVVVLSDYGKGTLQCVEQLISLARKMGKKVLVDPKGSDFSKYKHASLITPNFGEFTAIAGQHEEDKEIVKAAITLKENLDLEAMLVTRGEHGMTLIDENDNSTHLSAHAREVFDVTGAGDTVISVIAAALACGETLVDSTAVANIAAGIVVGKLGTAAITESELRLALKGEQEHDLGVVSKAMLLAAVVDAKTRGEKIVMTNGCFDILHAGHVSYLENARQLGDRLIVAINSDKSVKRLKGEKRPIVPLEQRMAVIAGLASVDWVVAFIEDTPENLICDVLPDILVKGGDYKAEDVAGFQCVKKNGGDVQILNFVDGVSTSNIIAEVLKTLED